MLSNFYTILFPTTLCYLWEMIQNIKFPLTTIHFKCQKPLIVPHLSQFLDVSAGRQCGLKSHGPFLTFELSSVRSSVPMLILRKYTNKLSYCGYSQVFILLINLNDEICLKKSLLNLFIFQIHVKMVIETFRTLNYLFTSEKMFLNI